MVRVVIRYRRGFKDKAEEIAVYARSHGLRAALVEADDDPPIALITPIGVYYHPEDAMAAIDAIHAVLRSRGGDGKAPR
ncbi:MAG: hypothetical protein F7B78_01745 [Desulfurococcales archaeon]|nr:hypothetical protein [Desulfurococcales archaeon]